MKSRAEKLCAMLPVIAIIMMVITFLLVYNKQPREILRVDTVKTVVHDTITKDSLIIEKQVIPKKIVETKIDTFYTDKGDTVTLKTEDKYFNKSIVMGLDTVDTEIHTRGINTSLEELKMRLRLHQVNTTETVEIIKYEEKKKRFIDRFHIGFQVGYGLGLKNKNFEPFVGFGGSMDL